jgi:ribosomal-protein-alanine N-acetyltransferase
MTIKAEATDAPDAEALAAIHAACFSQGWDAQAIAGLLTIEGTQAFVVQGAGFGMLRLLGQEAEILTLAVLPEKQKQGVGSAILRHMLDWAAERDARALFLEVGERNEATKKLYETRGFSVISRRREYYRRADGSHEDALVMRWERKP